MRDGFRTGQNRILEGLDTTTKSNYGDVEKALASFFSKENIPSNIKKSIIAAVSRIDVECGSPQWITRKYKYEKGMANEVGDGESGLIGVDINPSRGFIQLIATFKDKKAQKDAYDNIDNYLYKNKASLKYDDVDRIPFPEETVEIYFNGGDEWSWTAVEVQQSSSGIIVDVANYKNPITESALGTEIGLPLDKENCEGTDAASVSTPDGKVGEVKKIKRIVCPSCGSKDVNISEDEIFHCAACGHEWGIKEAQEVGSKDISKKRKSVKANESFSYKAGQKYKADDMDFTVKKVNKDGTIKIYDEDLKQTYDIEVSDLELLHPKKVDESKKK